jgi:hypothetical protein
MGVEIAIVRKLKNKGRVNNPSVSGGKLNEHKNPG